MFSPKKNNKAQPARPKLQKPAPKKRTPTKRKPENVAAVKTPAPSKQNAAGKYANLLHGALWVFVLGFAGYFAMSLSTFSVNDPSFLRQIPASTNVHNGGGLVGAYLADFGYYGLGLSVWWFVVAACIWLYKNFRLFNVENEVYSPMLGGIGLGIILLSSPMLERMMFEEGKVATVLYKDAGGWVGEMMSTGLAMYFGQSGSLFILLILMAAGLKLLVQFSYHETLVLLWQKARQVFEYLFERGEFAKQTSSESPLWEQSNAWLRRVSGSLNKYTGKINWAFWRKTPQKQATKSVSFPHKVPFEQGEQEQLPENAQTEHSLLRVTQSKPVSKGKKNPSVTDKTEDGAYRLPSMDSLRESDVLPMRPTAEELQPTADLITEKLAEFGIKVEVKDALVGPVITRYEIKPAKGVKGIQIVNLAKDLARSLSVQSVRVVETMHGKNTMGIELPNPVRQPVLLHDILSYHTFEESESKLSVALGVDIAGIPVIGDLALMPHLLVGGMTGSGKSVGVNAMIMSILFKAKPDEVRFIMIDPKMLELSVYDGIPHLLAPVITDMREAGHALNWCVAEMEKRYRLLAHVGVRHMSSFNEKIEEAKANGTPINNPFSLTPDEPEPLEKMAQIVIVIDELADLMMTERKAVETQIARLAQKARAAGMHMIIATQRPSVDVITGLIKANVPTRMAFTVQSKIDSRTILDQVGAEDLLKHGDVLFLQPGTAEPIRLQGAFVSDDEIHEVVAWIKEQAEPNYVEGLVTGEALSGSQQSLPFGSPKQGKDELFDKAVEFVISSRKTSISSLQRSLRIGYNRAANLMQELEDEGIVSPAAHNGTRRILDRE